MSTGKASLDSGSIVSSTKSPSTPADSQSIAARPSADANSTLTVEGSTHTASTGTTTTTSTSATSSGAGTAQGEFMEPEGPPTFFGTLARSYADVPISDDGVDTIAFLEASEGVLALFDLLGPTAFGIVIKDMSGNITKVRTRFLAAPLQSATLEQLVLNEQGLSKKTASEGLLWLLRGLQFTCIALRRSQNDHNEELSTSFTKAYEESLKKHHSFVIRPLFAIAMKACPYRRDFYEKLGPAEAVNIELNAWVQGLGTIVERVLAYYTKNKYDKF